MEDTQNDHHLPWIDAPCNILPCGFRMTMREVREQTRTTCQKLVNNLKHLGLQSHTTTICNLIVTTMDCNLAVTARTPFWKPIFQSVNQHLHDRTWEEVLCSDEILWLWRVTVKENICSQELAVSLHPYCLPRECLHAIAIVVYIPPWEHMAMHVTSFST